MAAPAAQAQDITARFYPEKQEYLVGEPIVIVLEVANDSSHDVGISDEHCDGLHPKQFQVTNAQLKTEIGLYGCAAWGGVAWSCASGARNTAPGAKFEQRWLLGQEESFDLSQPGVYHVKASRQVRVYGPGGFQDVIGDFDADSEFDIVIREAKEGELEAAYVPFVADLASTDYGTKGLAISAVTQNPPAFLENAILRLAAKPGTAYQSIDGLKRLGTPTARAKLIELESADDEGIRQQAIQALGQIGNSEDCDAILSTAARNKEYTQGQAYVAAGRICGEKAVPALAVLSASADQQLARAAATGLGNTGSREAVAILISVLVNSDAYVRREALGALCTLTHHGSRPEGVGDATNASQAYNEWRNWWAMNSQTATIYGPDECPATQSDQQ